MDTKHTAPDGSNIANDDWRASATIHVSDSAMMSSSKSSINVCNDAALLTADLMLKTPSFSGVKVEIFLSRGVVEPGLTSMYPT